MTNKEILTKIDYTRLNAASTEEEIFALCDKAVQYSTASVCIPPRFVSEVRAKYPQLNICTVIGFPLGYNTTAVKVFEAAEAIREGADEIDMVICVGDAKSARFDEITAEIAAVKQAVGGKILKVIIEACYLDEAEKTALCSCVTKGGADYIKTSTGFGSGGATFGDVQLFAENIGENVKIKAAGGIRTPEDMECYLKLGCSRIGASEGGVKPLLNAES